MIYSDLKCQYAVNEWEYEKLSILKNPQAPPKASHTRRRYHRHRVFKNRLKYDLKSNQIICQKYDLKSQSNHHFQNDLKSKSNQIVSPIGKLFLSFSYIYQPVL
jgi:hypothetical protein